MCSPPSERTSTGPGRGAARRSKSNTAAAEQVATGRQPPGPPLSRKQRDLKARMHGQRRAAWPTPAKPLCPPPPPHSLFISWDSALSLPLSRTGRVVVLTRDLKRSVLQARVDDAQHASRRSGLQLLAAYGARLLRGRLCCDAQLLLRRLGHGECGGSVFSFYVVGGTVRPGCLIASDSHHTRIRSRLRLVSLPQRLNPC